MCYKCFELAKKHNLEMSTDDFDSDEYKRELVVKLMIEPLIEEGYYFKKDELYGAFIAAKMDITEYLNATGLTLFSLIRDENSFRNLKFTLCQHILDGLSTLNKPNPTVQKFLDSVLVNTSKKKFADSMMRTMQYYPSKIEQIMTELGIDHYVDKNLWKELMKKYR